MTSSAVERAGILKSLPFAQKWPAVLGYLEAECLHPICMACRCRITNLAGLLGFLPTGLNIIIVLAIGRIRRTESAILAV
jgi:hypothetical protein